MVEFILKELSQHLEVFIYLNRRIEIHNLSDFIGLFEIESDKIYLNCKFFLNI